MGWIISLSQPGDVRECKVVVEEESCVSFQEIITHVVAFDDTRVVFQHSDSLLWCDFFHVFVEIEPVFERHFFSSLIGFPWLRTFARN